MRRFAYQECTNAQIRLPGVYKCADSLTRSVQMRRKQICAFVHCDQPSISLRFWTKRRGKIPTFQAPEAGYSWSQIRSTVCLSADVWKIVFALVFGKTIGQKSFFKNDLSDIVFEKRSTKTIIVFDEDDIGSKTYPVPATRHKQRDSCIRFHSQFYNLT